MSDKIDQLERLAALVEQGHLTRAEFDQQKAAVLGGSGAGIPLPSPESAEQGSLARDKTADVDDWRRLAARERRVAWARAGVLSVAAVGLGLAGWQALQPTFYTYRCTVSYPSVASEKFWGSCHPDAGSYTGCMKEDAGMRGTVQQAVLGSQTVSSCVQKEVERALFPSSDELPPKPAYACEVVREGCEE